MKSLDKKKPKKLDWEEEFDKVLNDYNCVIEASEEVYQDGRKVVKQFIKQLLTQQRTGLLEEIKDIEIGEADGWELARKFNCCPGDDMADAYNQALKDVIKLLKKL